MTAGDTRRAPGPRLAICRTSLAYALVRAVADGASRRPAPLDYAGSGFLDATRIAASPRRSLARHRARQPPGAGRGARPSSALRWDGSSASIAADDGGGARAGARRGARAARRPARERGDEHGAGSRRRPAARRRRHGARRQVDRPSRAAAGALADGRRRCAASRAARDVRATLGAIRALGARVERTATTVASMAGRARPRRGVDARSTARNSGTTMRLSAGARRGAARSAATLDGDASLRAPADGARRRRRCARWARTSTTDRRDARRSWSRAARSRGVDWTLPVASAQVKSAVLLAGLRAAGTTRVRRAARDTRSHRAHAPRTWASACSSSGRARRRGAADSAARAADVALPGDPSSAAFLVVAALAGPGLGGPHHRRRRESDAHRVPRRPRAHGRPRSRIERGRDAAGEPVGDAVVTPRRAPRDDDRAGRGAGAIDELPILAVAAAFAEGETRDPGAAELRVKESDRLAALEQLRGLGAAFEATPDGFVVAGARPRARAAAASRRTAITASPWRSRSPACEPATVHDRRPAVRRRVLSRLLHPPPRARRERGGGAR